MKIYFNHYSNNCLKALWTARLAGTELEIQQMDFQKDLKTEAYLQIHPAGKVPAIDDDDFVLFESGAVMRYLARKAKSDLYPDGDLQKVARIDQWIDFATMHVGVPMGKVAFNRAWAPMMKLPVNEAAITENEKFLDQYLPVIEKQLAGQTFLAGDQLSLADVALLAATYYAEPAQVDLSGYPALSAWRAEMMDRVGAEPMQLGG